ncbi:hypothetical protein SANTM175S_10088 [Streptomyces antimycoticus]
MKILGREPAMLLGLVAVLVKVAKLAADLTRKVNALTAEYEGRPVDEVKPAIQDVWARETGGGSITDPELTQLAEQIAAGGRVSVELA